MGRVLQEAARGSQPRQQGFMQVPTLLMGPPNVPLLLPAVQVPVTPWFLCQAQGLAEILVEKAGGDQ